MGHFRPEFWWFCSLTYLSLFPDSLLRSYITGGVPSISRHPDDVYQATFKRTMDKNRAFFEQFPQAQTLCQQIADHLLTHNEYLPNGQRFTVEQFQQTGIHFGMSDTFLATYYLLENAFINLNGKAALRYEFCSRCWNNSRLTPTQSTPFYMSRFTVRFCVKLSAHRVRQAQQVFDYQPGQAFYFTGEMVFLDV